MKKVIMVVMLVMTTVGGFAEAKFKNTSTITLDEEFSKEEIYIPIAVGTTAAIAGIAIEAAIMTSLAAAPEASPLIAVAAGGAIILTGGGILAAGGGTIAGLMSVFN